MPWLLGTPNTWAFIIFSFTLRLDVKINRKIGIPGLLKARAVKLFCPEEGYPFRTCVPLKGRHFSAKQGCGFYCYNHCRSIILHFGRIYHQSYADSL